MRLISVLLIISTLQVSARSYSQQVNLKARQITLAEAFKQIETQTGYSFFWDQDLLQNMPRRNLSLSHATVQEAMKACLKDLPLGYSIKDKIIFIKRLETHMPPAAKTVPAARQIQRLVVRGTVTDAASNAPLVAASIHLLGTKRGTSSNTKGYFELEAAIGDTIVVSYIGHESKSIAVRGPDTLNVKLTVSSQSLNDMVVTGVFERSKANFTGAASSFTSEDLAKVSNTNLFAALSALDPSFHITENILAGSDPNKLPDIVLRGGNSLINPSTDVNAIPFNYQNRPNTPLFILDGFETSLQQINDLDMNRIAKVDILKDAAATAIYGSRAANGVIVIETVRPKAGKLRITYTGNLQVATPDLSGYDLLNAEEKLDLEQKADVYKFYDWNARTQRLQYFYNARKAAVEKGVNTDWLAQPVHTGIGQKHNIFLEGGADAAQYGINLTYNNNPGVMKGSSRQNGSANTYLSYRINNLQFRNELTLNFNKGVNSPYGSFAQYAQLNPYWSPYNENGQLAFYLEDVRDGDGVRLNDFDSYNNLDGQGPSRPINPMYNTSLHTINQSSYQNLIENFFIQWQVNNWLKISSKLAYQKQNDESDIFLPAQATQFSTKPTFEKGTYTKGIGKRNSLEELLTADINKHFGKHQIFGTAGMNISESKFSQYSFTVQGFPNPSLDQLTLGNKFPDNSKPVGSENLTRMFSLLSNLSYSYDNRYLLDLSFRRDGSSQFGTRKRFAPLWSVGAGWNLDKEAFMKNQSVIDRLKLRYSFGYTGSQNFPAYLGITTTQYYTDNAYRGIIGSYLLGYGNQNLGWQKTQKNNLGMDLTVLKNLDITANYFLEKTQGSIATISTAPSSGFGSYSANLGDLQSNGWELSARYTIFNNLHNRNNWSVFVNGTHVKTTITKISKEIEAMNKAADVSYSTAPVIRYAEGQSTSAIWAVRSMGIDPSTGQEIFLSKSGDLVTTYNPLDKVIVGDSRPKIEGNFGTNFELKGIGLNLYFRYQFGGQTFNQTLIDRVENVNVALYNVDHRVSEQRWLQPGDLTFFKGLVGANGGTVSSVTYASSRFVQDYKFMSIESASIYYRFPEKLNQRLKLNNTKVTFFTSDLLWLSSIKRERGLDYPYSHTYTLQFTTTF